MKITLSKAEKTGAAKTPKGVGKMPKPECGSHKTLEMGRKHVN